MNQATLQHRFQNIETAIRKGTIAGSSTWSSTSVSGGETTHYADGSTHTSPITSSTAHHHKFFVCYDGGGEGEFFVQAHQFGTRNGQRVSVIWGRKEGQEKWTTCFCFNHNTGAHVTWNEAYRLFGVRWVWEILVSIAILPLSIYLAINFDAYSLLVVVPLIWAIVFWAGIFPRKRAQQKEIVAAFERSARTGIVPFI